MKSKLIYAAALSLSVISTGLATDNLLMPAFGATPPETHLSDARSAIGGVRNALSDFESKLEFPMSEPEKKTSQNKLNAFKKSFKPAAKDLTAHMVSKTAHDALVLARKASKEAEEGERAKALSLFTYARIQLWKANSLLKALQSKRGGLASRTRLQGQANKDDALLASGKGRLARPAAPGNPSVLVQSSGGARSSTVRIGPGGINVSDRNPGVTDRTRVNIGSTGSISVRSNTTPGQTGVSINPGGIDVGTRQPGRTTGVNISPAGIHVADGSDRVTITPGVGGQIGGLGQAISDIARAGINVGLNAAQAGIRTGMGAAQAGINTGISAANAGLSGAGAGLDATIGSGTGISVTPSGNSLTITGRDNVRTYNLNGQHVTITGRDNRITLRGYCSGLSIMGRNNDIHADTVRAISITGRDNNISYGSGPNGTRPSISNLGKRNRVFQTN